MEEHTDEQPTVASSIAMSVATSVYEMLEAVKPSEHKEPLTTIISRVPKIIGLASLYKPCMVSIGPINCCHHVNFEHHKCRLLKSFLCRNEDLFVYHYIQALQSLDAHEYYDENSRKWYHLSRPNKEKFIKMLLLDGCFILELFFKWLNEDPDVLFKERRGQNTIFSDLLMLENQIPFVVIEKLYNLVMTGQRGTSRNTFLSLLTKFLSNEEPSHYTPLVTFPETIHNLLDLYHQFLIATTSLCQDQKKHHTTELPLWQQRLTHSVNPRLDQRDANRPPRQIPSATVLYEAGIKFKKNQSPKNLFDVTFSRGILKIPLLQIDDNTKALLVNLIALERHKTWEKQIVTSYVILMDSLINTEGDVALLQRDGVIYNILSSHQEAAIFFNELGGSLFFDTVNHHFAKLFMKVQLYYESKWNRNWARLMHDYFNSPWAIISVIAGVILLSISMLQTFYTVYPYYRPRSQHQL